MSTSDRPSEVAKHHHLNSAFKKVGEGNFWVEFTGLAREYNAVNLGQGFPDYASYAEINDKVKEIADKSSHLIHQYTRSAGNLK